MLNKSNMNKLAAVLVSCFAVAGCSGSGGCCSSGGSNSNNGNVSSLQIVAPKTIFSKPAESSPGYIVIKNPTDTAVSNLHYDLSNLVGGANGTIIDSDSAASCATMPAHGQCNVKVMIPAGAVAGSLGFSANNDSSLLSKLGKAFNDSVTKTTTLTIGIQQAAYNNLSGADGITLSYYHTVINGVPYILVTGLVASANAGSFNNIVLVDHNGNPIPNQELISEVISSAQGTTFQILLPVPAGGGITQTIKVQTQHMFLGETIVVSTSTSSSTLSTTEAGVTVGIVDMLPDAVYLTQEHPEQTITFSNSGDAAAQLQSLLASNPNIEVTFSQGSLGSGETTIATLKLKDPTVPATSGDITVTYNNGQQEVSDSAVVEENVIPAPTPGPSPMPTPSAPAAGLTAILSPDNNFFMTTANGTVTRQMTITNTGNTDENGIVLTLPTGFSISDGNSNSCTVSGNNNITNTLIAKLSCDVTVTYANTSAVNPAQSTSISIAYKYNNGTSAPSPATAAVKYKVTQSTANLTLQSPADPFSFPTTLLEGLGETERQTYVIRNSGDGEATSLSGVVNSTTSAGLFSSYTAGLTNACGATLAAGASCEYGVQFGAILDGTSAGQKNGNLTASYKIYPAAASSINLVANFYGQVATANSAKFETPASGTAGSSFEGSWPSLGIAQGTASGNTITYTITNSGTDSANNFQVTLPGAQGGWYAPTTDCPTTTGAILASGGSCTVSIGRKTTSSFAAHVPYLNVGLAWTDQDSPSGETQNMQLPLPSVEVYGPPSIAITPTTTSQAPKSVDQGSSFNITAILSGGFNVPVQTIQATQSSAGTTGTTLSNGGQCNLSSAQRSCAITVTIGPDDNATQQLITLANTTSSAVAQPVPAAVDYTVQPVRYIFVTSAKYTGNLLGEATALSLSVTTGLEGADEICRYVASSQASLYKDFPNGVNSWKAVLAGNKATSSGIITYKYKTGSSTSVLVATGTATLDPIWNNLTYNTLTNRLGADESGLSASYTYWTGANPGQLASPEATTPSGWTTYSNTNEANNCNGWTQSSKQEGQSYNAGVFGYGMWQQPWGGRTVYARDNDGFLIKDTSDCGLRQKLLCVQQPAQVSGEGGE